MPVEQWSYNLWPRSSFDVNGAPIPFGNAQIADFAPDDEDFLAHTVPEPGTLGTGALGAALALIFWRWKVARG